MRLYAQESVLVGSFVDVENGRTQIVENQNSSAFSYKQDQVMFSGCPNANLRKKKRRTWPTCSQQQMALCDSIVRAVSLVGEDLPVIVIPACRQCLRHDAEIDHGIDLVELSPSLTTRTEICDAQIAMLLAILGISDAEQRERKGSGDLLFKTAIGRLAANPIHYGKCACSISDHHSVPDRNDNTIAPYCRRKNGNAISIMGQLMPSLEASLPQPFAGPKTRRCCANMVARTQSRLQKNGTDLTWKKWLLCPKNCLAH